MRISRIRKRNEFRFILYYPLDLGWFALDPVLVFKLRVTQREPSVDVVIVSQREKLWVALSFLHAMTTNPV